MSSLQNRDLLIVIQGTNFCNLNCKYCYVPNRTDKSVMSDSILERTLETILKSEMLLNFPGVTLCWHAGEPLSAGKEFYNKVVKATLKYNINKIKVKHNIQTNATLIDQEWCNFFQQNDFQVNVSIDGPEFIHNRSRLTWKGRGTHKQVMRGINTLKRNKFPITSISVLSPFSLDYPEELFEFFYLNEFSNVCFNFEETDGNNELSSYFQRTQNELNILSKKFQDFFSKFYDIWLLNNMPFRVREFKNKREQILLLSQNNSKHVKNTENIPFQIITISKDGDISTFSPELISGVPTDSKKFIIGNVLNINSLDELSYSPRFLEIAKEIDDGIEKCARNCSYFNFCGGGSPSNKYFENGSFNSSETLYCHFHQKIVTDVVIDKMKSHEKLLQGVSICNKSFQENRALSITINNGTKPVVDVLKSNELGNKAYEKTAIVPSLNWRSLSGEENNILFSDKNWMQERMISIITLPSIIINPVLKILEDYSDSMPSKIVNQFVDNSSQKDVQNLLSYIKTTFHGENEGFEPQYLRTNQITFPTCTTNKETNLLIGLHLDSWDRKAFNKRSSARNRLCINLGKTTRYLLFINQTLRQISYMVNIPLGKQDHYENNPTHLLKAFMEQNPKYPVIKVAIEPGQAYIAPTENIIHDGCYSDESNLDISWTFLGYFSPRNYQKGTEIVINKEKVLAKI